MPVEASHKKQVQIQLRLRLTRLVSRPKTGTDPTDGEESHRRRLAREIQYCNQHLL